MSNNLLYFSNEIKERVLPVSRKRFTSLFWDFAGQIACREDLSSVESIDFPITLAQTLSLFSYVSTSTFSIFSLISVSLVKIEKLFDTGTLYSISIFSKGFSVFTKDGELFVVSVEVLGVFSMDFEFFVANSENSGLNWTCYYACNCLMGFDF